MKSLKSLIKVFAALILAVVFFDMVEHITELKLVYESAKEYTQAFMIYKWSQVFKGLVYIGIVYLLFKELLKNIKSDN